MHTWIAGDLALRVRHTLYEPGSRCELVKSKLLVADRVRDGGIGAGADSRRRDSKRGKNHSSRGLDLGTAVRRVLHGRDCRDAGATASKPDQSHDWSRAGWGCGRSAVRRPLALALLCAVDHGGCPGPTEQLYCRELAPAFRHGPGSLPAGCLCKSASALAHALRVD